MKPIFETLGEELVAIDCMANDALVKYYGTNDREVIENGVVNWWKPQIDKNELKEVLLLIKKLKVV
jgi:hypothetical protein